MNMISTGAFQTEMDASNNQPTLAEKFAAVWEKKNAKAARAGGVSLMALSLAACGSDSDTTATTTDTTTTTTDTTTTVTPVNQNLTLTTGIDTIVGGDGDDTIIGSSGNANTATIIAGDTVDGGAGSDTMLFSVSGATTVSAGVSLSNVETVRIVDTTTTAGTVNLAGSTGITTIDVNASSGTALTISNVAAIADLNLTNTAGTGTTTLTYTGAATTGTQSQNVVLNNAAATGNISIAGVETVSVTSATDGSTASMILAAAGTVNLSGAGDTTLTLSNAANTSIAVVDASASTGDNTIVVDADLDPNGLAVTGGAGADTINISAGALGATDSVDGGDGADTLLWREGTNDITSVAAALATVSNVETLSLRADDNGGANAVDFTIDLDTTEGVTAIALNARDTGTVNVFTLNDLTDAQAGAVSLSYVAGALAATVDYDFKDGSGTATVAPEKAVLNASIVQGSTTTVQDSSDTAEELTVNVTSSAATQTLTIDAADFDASLTVTGGAAGTTLDMDATNITSDIVDLSGVTSNILWAGGNDTQTVTGGSGDDKFTFTTFLDYQDSVDGGAGNDRVVIDPAASITQAVTLTNIEELEIGATATVSVTMTGQTVPEVVLQAQATTVNVVTLTNAAGITNILATGGAAGGTLDNFNGLTLSGTGYAATTDALTMSLVASTDTVDTGAFTLTGIEDLTIAVTGADTDLNATIGTGITGSSLNNVIVTSSGYGASSDSTDIVLGTVNDGGSDTMLSFDASGANTGVSVTLADMQAASVVEGSAYYDTISVAGSGTNVIVNGGAGNDTLTAATGATTLNGGTGNDTLNGGAGGDFLNSGTGNDTIDGNGGADTVVLGVGSHTLIHAGDGTGDGSYTISGFTAGAGGDVIDLQSNAASESAATVANYESVANGGTVSAGTGLVVVGGTSIGGVAEADVVTLLGAGGANITLLGLFNLATDEFYLLTDDGTNSYLFNVDSGGTTAGVTAAEETVTLYATFSGITDCTTLTAANFADFL